MRLHCSITANQFQRMAYNVIDFKTWHTLQLWTENLPHDRAFAVQLHWLLPLQFLPQDASICDGKDGSNVDTVSTTSSQPMTHFDVPFLA